VTFLFTDLEASTRLWEEFPDAMQDALARHDALVQGAVADHNGYVVKTTGDGAHAAFATARHAIDAALDAQLALSREEWGDTGPLHVRMGLHTGVSELRDGDYYGTAVNRAARIASVAHGDQVVCSQATADLARDDLPDTITLTDLGEHRLRDLSTPERVFQVTHMDLRTEFPALRSLDAFPGNLPLQLSAFVGATRNWPRWRGSSVASAWSRSPAPAGSARRVSRSKLLPWPSPSSPTAHGLSTSHPWAIPISSQPRSPRRWVSSRTARELRRRRSQAHSPPDARSSYSTIANTS
jgi:class 3 adenylate cyclase